MVSLHGISGIKRLMMKNNKKQEFKNEIKKSTMGIYFSLLFRIGFKMVASITLFFSIGLYLVQKKNFNEAILIVSIFLGVMGGFYIIYKDITNLPK